ncbi:MAG: acyl-CoA dehydrogenase family protein [Gammaproteobacteria bacterium]|nr:acyl-CoA dehydrogenase family protein [Gammaproteobacteria bacterium]
MSPYRPPISDTLFLYRDVFQLDQDWQSWNHSNGLNLELAEAILIESGKLATDVLEPLSRPGDEEGAHWQDGKVRAPTGFQKAFLDIAGGGWLGLGGNPDWGGQGMPKSIGCAVEEFFWGSNTSLWLYASLTLGATHCIDAHGSQEIKQLYLRPMYEGRWTGAMALTEPHAGTDLGMIRTRAEPLTDGSYRLDGMKIFITSGEHDLCENIVHLVLARLVDAPAGTKGISLFLVPKFLPDSQGQPSQRNGFSSISIEEKMGIHGSATSTIVYDNAIGYMVGEPNRGLSCMFTMMNFARVSVGLQGLGLAERAYQLAVDYSKERLQGRVPTGPVNVDGPADPLIEHADIRRMLLTQRVYTEGSRALAILVAHQLDLTQYSMVPENREQAQRFVDLLTPIAKSFMTDRAMESVLLAQQCFGGHGYIRETGVEQIVRDTRISQIYEGTNGIQALDLVGRKVVQNSGEYVLEFAEFMRQSVSSGTYADEVNCAIDDWVKVSQDICARSRERIEFASAVAVDYLDLSGHVIYAWIWKRMADCDDGTFGKKHLARYYFDKIFPIAKSHLARISAGPDAITLPASSWF